MSLGESESLSCRASSHHCWGRRCWQGVRQMENVPNCSVNRKTKDCTHTFLLGVERLAQRTRKLALGTPPACTRTLTQALPASPRGLPTGWFLKDQKDKWFRSACSWFLLRICNLTIRACFLLSAYMPLIKSSLCSLTVLWKQQQSFIFDYLTT